MRRITSVILAVLVFVSTFTGVSADLSTSTSYVPNPLNMELALSVGARISGEEAAYTAELPLLINEGESSKGVDYQTTLDMSRVRDLFNESFIQTVLPNDEALRTEFNNGVVSTTINVAITYPEAAIISENLESSAVGQLDAGSIFSEKSRELTGNTLTIQYVNSDQLKVSQLDDNADGVLKDIKFTLNDVVSYNQGGRHQVFVTLSGSTSIAFASKTQNVNYNGSASHIVTATKEITDHVLVVVPVIPATCKAPGYTEGVKCATHDSYACAISGIVEPIQLPQINHSCFHADRVEATCSTYGIEAHDTCVFCKDDFQGGTYTNGQGFGEYTGGVFIEHDDLMFGPDNNAHTIHTENEIPSTCTKRGVSAWAYCTTCGKVTSKPIVLPFAAHTEVTVPAVAATCEGDGRTQSKTCSVCHVAIEQAKTIPALGHNYGEWTTDPQRPNWKIRICQNDENHTESVEIPPTVHTHVIEPNATVEIKASCTAAGSKKYYCACGYLMSEEAIPALGHRCEYMAPVAATCVSTGKVEHYVCVNSGCGKMFRDILATNEIKSADTSIDKNNHGGNIVRISDVPATCQHKGMSAGAKCKACNVITIPQTVSADFAPHVMETIDEVPAGCDTNGAKLHQHCKVCDKDFDMQGNEISYWGIPAKGHSWGDTVREVTAPTQTTDGVGEKTCTICGGTKQFPIKYTGHTHNEIADEIIQAETCTAEGWKRKIYSCCGEVIDLENTTIELDGRVETKNGEKVVIIPPHAHILTFVPTVNATCFTEGVGAHYICEECHKLFSPTDNTVEIQSPAVLAKTVHRFIEISPDVKRCEHCGEIVRINIETDAGASVDVGRHGGIKSEEDKIREDAADNVVIESKINISKKPEISKELEAGIPGSEQGEAVAFDIFIEKIITHDDGDKDIEIISEVNDLVTIVIDIPVELRNSINYNVIRLHNGVAEVLTTIANPVTGEYIEIDLVNYRVTVHAKKFSEYAIVALNPGAPPLTPPGQEQGSGSSGGGKILTIKFNANGGTEIKDMRVNPGQTITPPVPEREGYIFTGWYTDIEFTELFDFNTKIVGNLTLYAGWKKDDGQSGEDWWFKDVPEAEWFYKPIKEAYYDGLMKGVSADYFEPNSGMTRAMFVTVLYRIENEPETTENVFVDVETDTWYTDAVAWATQAGVTNGVSETEFAPDRVIIREQIVAMLYRYAQFKGYDVSVGENANILSYTDAEDISEYAVPAFQWAVSEGIVEGKSETTLNPIDNTTRAEAAALLTRVANRYSK